MTRPCPACGAIGGREAGEKNGHRMIRCSHCATLHTADVPGGEVLHDLYGEYYGETNLDVPAFVVNRLREIVATFAPYRERGTLLDVGFGAGALMEVAREAGWAAEGTEVSERAVEHAVSRGFKAFCGTLAEARFPDASFDVVCAVEIFEHLTDPADVLREIARILRPGGLLWATTPHGLGLSARVMKAHWSVVSPPEHIQLFSIAGLTNLLRRAGFSGARIAAQGTNPSELARHLLRRGAVAPSDRVASAYQLNEFLNERPLRRKVKNGINALLAATRLGDSLKVYATR